MPRCRSGRCARSAAPRAASPGADGAALATQGAAFYRRVLEAVDRHGDLPLESARVLDFGCGWGRLTRMLARDVAPGRLYGCDPVQAILDVCRDCRVPGTFRRTEFVPERLPFEAPFDVAVAFSVFTHLSEAAHAACLRALHAALRPGALLVLTVRPPGHVRAPGEGGYRFAPHPADPRHPQYRDGGMTYGDAEIDVAYVRERWARWFELLSVDLMLADLHQLVLVLRRR